MLLQLIDEVCIMPLSSYPPVTMGERGEEAAAAAPQQPGQVQPQLRIGGLPPWMISHLNA
jgi:MADS-box transcription factor